MTKAKTPNYSDEQIAIIRAAAPLNFDSAKVIADQIGKPHKGVVAICARLGIAYEGKKAARKRGTPKADLLASIAVAVGSDTAELAGLEKATVPALTNLLARLA